MEYAFPHPIKEIHDRAEEKPYPEPFPCDQRQTGHQENTRNDSKDRKPWTEWDFKRSLAIGFFHPHDNHTQADERECEERSDIREIHHLIDVHESGKDRYDKSGKNRRNVRSLESRMYSGECFWKQPVPRHREKDSRLTQLKHKKNRCVCNHGTEGDNSSDPVKLHVFHRHR